MATKFTDTHGSAKKQKIDYYTFKDGANVFRMVGDILPRYVYWKKNTGGNNLSVECLSFDRDLEQFTNIEKDYFREYFPDEKCQWAYLVQVIDIENDGKVKTLGLKKKLFEQIRTAAEDLGDPTDTKIGWDIHLIKKKTGPQAYNVEYTLQPLRCKKRALTTQELAALEEAKTIDELFPRPTPEEQKAFIERNYLNNKSTVEEESNVDTEVLNELEEKDTPF